MPITGTFYPHGMCWQWDWRLISLHGISDLLTFAAYAMISTTAFYVYRRGGLSRLAYPELWTVGAAFVFLCGMSHLGNFLEIFIGGKIYWLTGINKIAMSFCSLRFAAILFSLRQEFLSVAEVLRRIRMRERERGNEDEDGPETGTK